jgi:hypothetical protein
MWQYADFVEQIKPLFEGNAELIESHNKFVRTLNNGETLGDDFSMLEVRF